MLIIPFVLFLFTSVKSQNLIFVYNHFRHGARSPLVDNNISILKNPWKNGGELTDVGHRQHYTLGLHKRYRYKDFLSYYYNPSEIFIISSDYNRTILSASSQLQGLYPPGRQPDFPIEKFNKSFPPIYDPESLKKLKTYALELGNDTIKEKVNNIPVHVSKNKEKLLLIRKAFCPKLKKLKKDEIELKSIAKEFNEKFGKFMYNYINKSKDYFTNFTHCSSFCDVFIAEYFDKRDFQDFENRTKINISELYSGCKNIHYHNYFTKEYGKNNINSAFVFSSNLFRYMLSFLKKRIDFHLKKRKKIYSQEPTKMLMTSLHDSTLSSMETVLNHIFKDVHSFVPVMFASNIAIEVYQDENKSTLSYSDYYVEYRVNDILMKTINLKDFVDTLESNIWDKKKIEDFCLMTDNLDRDYEKLLKKSLFVTIISSSIAALFFFISLAVLLFKNNCSLPCNRNKNSLISDKVLPLNV